VRAHQRHRIDLVPVRIDDRRGRPVQFAQRQRQRVALPVERSRAGKRGRELAGAHVDAEQSRLLASVFGQTVVVVRVDRRLRVPHEPKRCHQPRRP